MIYKKIFALVCAILLAPSFCASADARALENGAGAQATEAEMQPLEENSRHHALCGLSIALGDLLLLIGATITIEELVRSNILICHDSPVMRKDSNVVLCPSLGETPPPLMTAGLTITFAGAAIGGFGRLIWYVKDRL